MEPDDDVNFQANEAFLKRLEGIALARRQRESRLSRQQPDIHPTESQVAMPAAKSGYLDKKEHMLWKTQFFRLSLADRTLEYFVVAQFTDGTKHFSLIGHIRLAGAVLVAKRGIHAGKHRVLQFEITPAHSKKTTILRAKTEEDMDQWLCAIQLCVADSVPTIEAVNFLKNRERRRQGGPSRTSSVSGDVDIHKFNNSNGNGVSTSLAFSWQQDPHVIKEGLATKLKFGCEGSSPHDWEIVYLRLEEGATVLDYFTVVTGPSGIVPGFILVGNEQTPILFQIFDV